MQETMKLYNLNLSNFATKCRIAIYEKGADVEIVAPPGGNMKSPEYFENQPAGQNPDAGRRRYDHP